MKLLSTYIPNPRSGFTLLEVIIVLGIMAVIFSLGLFLSMDFYRGYAFRSELHQVVSILQKARAQSLSNINGSPHGVHITSTTYTIFQGADWGSRDTSQDENLSASPTVSHLGMTDAVFAQLSGNATILGGDLIITQGVSSSTISINNAGQINW